VAGNRTSSLSVDYYLRLITDQLCLSDVHGKSSLNVVPLPLFCYDVLLFSPVEKTPYLGIDKRAI
jgi:hypothetical protein